MSQTELHQVLKFPIFVQHFFEHKAENKDISLSQFIVLHYFSGNPVDDDYARDMQLPFKTSDCVASITTMIIQEYPEFTICPIIVTQRSSAKVINDWKPSNFITDIFRPPQFS